MTIFKPMLAGKADFATIRFPLLASGKIDGIRSMAMEGRAMTRSMKTVPNLHIKKLFFDHGAEMHGLDGELIVGNPTDPDVYRNTVSQVMAEEKVPVFRYLVFDLWDYPTSSTEDRLRWLKDRMGGLPSFVELVKQKLIRDLAELEDFEAECLQLGYEGIMTRDPRARYKQGRASTKSQELLKVKRYEDCEAMIIGFEEKMHNGNEAQTNELGRTARSSHQANKTGLNTLGALVVRGIAGTPFDGIEFNIGTGFNDAERASMWSQKQQLTGSLVKFKFFPVGVKEAPRHPVYLGARASSDR